MTKFKAKIDEMKTLLPSRIKQRETMASGSCYLDLRSTTFGNMGRVVLHDPKHPLWPEAGRTTKSIREATTWINQRYAEWLAIELTVRELAAREGDDIETLTVARACDCYLEHIARRKDKDHRTVKNRESQVRIHILPKFGARPFTSLTKREVRDWLNALTVAKQAESGYKRVEAAMNSKRSMRTTLLAIWRHSLPDLEPPFAGVWLDDRDNKPLHKQIVSDEETLAALLQPRSGALREDQLKNLLVAAMWYDQTVLGRPNMRAISVANTAFAIAFYCATGCRLEEGIRARWFMVNELKGSIVINSVKNSKHPIRIVPLQDSLVPWLHEARQEQERRMQTVGSRDLLLQTQPKNGKAERSTLQKRLGMALRLANLKQPMKAVHGLRATFATMLATRPDVLTTPQLKRYLGHSEAYKGATDVYIAQLDEEMDPAHRAIIALPAPDEVREAAAFFMPANRLHWRETWRRPHASNPEVRERQVAKQQERLSRLRANYSSDESK